MPSLETPWFGVPALKERFALVDFVETGCDKGVSLEVARRYGFENLYSCDINPEHVEWAQRSVPEALIIEVTSTDFLSIILAKSDFFDELLGDRPAPNRPTLFWLDAHFPYVLRPDGTRDEGTPEQQYPLFDELAIIAERKGGVEHDVILCDDICQIHALDNPRYRPGECDWKHLNPRPFAEYVALFERTHDWHVFHEDTGALLFTPKAIAEAAA